MAMEYKSNLQIARRIYRSLKTPSDNNPKTDPILAFHFKGKSDYIIFRCNKRPELSIKGKDQIAGEVKFFAYSDFADFHEGNVIFQLKEDISLIELYKRGAIKAKKFKSWREFTKWLDTLKEEGIPISLKLPYLVYQAVKNRKPSMQNFIVESIKSCLKEKEE